MASTRQYDFIVGPETSTLPTAGTPSVDADTITKGYADDYYTQGGASVADITALKAVAAANRNNGDALAVRSTRTIYVFDSSSSATGDDVRIITPSAGTGRWVQANTDNFRADSIVLNYISAPSTPSTGTAIIYPKSDGILYYKDDAGNETSISSVSTLDAPYDAKNYSISASVAANALTIALKTKAGSDPSGGSAVNVSFRNSTLATGDYSNVSITAATSITVPSTATLGHTSGATENIYVYLLNNAGTAELLVCSTPLDQNAQHTTTAIDTSSNSISGKYSTTARTSVAIKYIGKILISEATAGTWASGATQIDISDLNDHLPTAQSNSEATKFGFKTYSHGTTYNNSSAPTVTLNSGGGTLSTVHQADFYPYQVQNGVWRCRFNIDVELSSASRTQVFLSVNGITAKSTGSSFGQAITGSTNPDAATKARCFWQENTSLLKLVHSTATTTNYSFSGDVLLNSKPTWAY